MTTNRGFADLFVLALAICLIPAVASAQWVDADGNPVVNPGDTTVLFTTTFWSFVREFSTLGAGDFRAI